MSFFHCINGVQIIGDDTGAGGVQVVVQYGFQAGTKIMAYRTFPHHQETAVSEALQSIFRTDGFVIGGNAGCQTDIHVLVGYPCQMSLNGFTFLSGNCPLHPALLWRFRYNPEPVPQR